MQCLRNCALSSCIFLLSAYVTAAWLTHRHTEKNFNRLYTTSSAPAELKMARENNRLYAHKHYISCMALFYSMPMLQVHRQCVVCRLCMLQMRFAHRQSAETPPARPMRLLILLLALLMTLCWQTVNSQNETCMYNALLTGIQQSCSVLDHTLDSIPVLRQFQNDLNSDSEVPPQVGYFFSKALPGYHLTMAIC